MLAMADFGVSMNLGVLPYPGSFMEQPHTVVLWFRILNGAYNEANAEEIESAKAQ